MLGKNSAGIKAVIEPKSHRALKKCPNSMAGEHMTSFDYAYKIEAVRDWLFAQNKAE